MARRKPNLTASKMPTVLLSNNTVKNYAGSELVTIELAKEFILKGYAVTIATFAKDATVLREVNDLNVSWLDLNVVQPIASTTVYDLIWAHHFTTLDAILMDLKISAKAIIFSSMSPYEPLECPPTYASQLSLLLANSVETKNQLLEYGLPDSKIHIFPNPVSKDWFTFIKLPRRPGLSKVAVVSNHVAKELGEAVISLRELGISVEVFGIGQNYQLVTPALLAEFDCIVTIGRTVQQAMVLGLPVYCYDRFGGPGYISAHNFEKAAEFNFSGRCSKGSKTATELVLDITSNYESAITSVDQLRTRVREQFPLGEAVTRVLKLIASSSLPQLLDTPGLLAHQRIRRYANKDDDSQLFPQLYLDVGPGLSEEKSIKIFFQQIPSLRDPIDLVFDVSAIENLVNVRFDPINTYAIVSINRVEILRLDGRVDITSIIESNANKCVDNAHYFIDEDPQISFSNAIFIGAKHIAINLTYHAIGSDALRTYIEKQKLPPTASAVEPHFYSEDNENRTKELSAKQLFDIQQSLDCQMVKLSAHVENQELLSAEQLLNAHQRIEAQSHQLLTRADEFHEKLGELQRNHAQQIDSQKLAAREREESHLAELAQMRQTIEIQLLQLVEREKAAAEQLQQLREMHEQERSAQNQAQAERQQAHHAELALARQKVETQVLQFRSQKEVLETEFAREKSQLSAQLANLSRHEKLSRDLSSELQLKLKAQEKVSDFAVEEQERARTKFAKDLNQEKLLLQTETAQNQRILKAQADFLQREYERNLKDARLRHERREGQLNTQLTTAQNNLDRANSELATQHKSFAVILSSNGNDHRNYLEEIRRHHQRGVDELLALKNSVAEDAKNFQQAHADRQVVFEQHILERERAAEGFKADASARLIAERENSRHINLLLSAEQVWHEKAELLFSELKMKYENECEQIIADFKAIAAIPWWRAARKARVAKIAFKKHSSKLPALEFSVVEHNWTTAVAKIWTDALPMSATSTTQRLVDKGSAPTEISMNIQQIMAYKGNQFIKVAYRQILGRDSDVEGETYYTQRLKSGVPKIEILAQLRMSSEGKKFNTKILGINEVITEYKWTKIPLLGAFIKNRMKFHNDLNSRFEGLEERIGILNQKMGTEFAELHRVIQSRFTELSVNGIPTNKAALGGVFSELGAVALEASRSVEIPNYFDSNWYTTQYPELDLQGLSPYEHFLKYGAEIGCQPAFDADWYKSEYPDVTNAGVDPFEHFLSSGKAEGRHPAFDTKWYLKQYGDEVDGDAYAHYVSKGRENGNYPAFDRAWYLSQYKDVASIKMDPYEHYTKYGRAEGRRPAYNPMDKPLYESRTTDFPVAYASEYQAELNFDNLTTDIKAVTFFLPQFHRCDQNDRWWGEGFTEWTNTKSSKPNFPGHYQPREPHANIGYYDLSDVETLRKQAALAKAHGIHGFCFYHYWFSGDRILEKPVDLLVANKDIDIKFMLCWANENWTKTWDGQESNILLEQKYLLDDPVKFISDISKYVKDSRYICVNGKPVIMVYKPQVIPRVKDVFQIWRGWWRENVGGEILIWCNRTNFEDTAVKSLADAVDAVVEFPPHVVQYEIDQAKMGFDTNGHFFDYQHFAADIQNGSERTNNPAIKFYRSVMLGWDNSARRKNGWSVWYGFSLQVYYDWLKHTIKYARETFKEDERFVFINAWNEWAEGTYLEPDVKSGYASINTTSKALFDLPFKEATAVLKPLAPVDAAPGKIAVHAHLYFEDVAKEMMDYLNRIPYPFDLFITTDSKSKVDKFSKLFKAGGRQRNLAVIQTPNIGRDIAPLMVEMCKKLAAYDFIGHFHTKKSTTVKWGDQWRHYLLNNLLGSKEIIAGIFAKFTVDPKLGLMFPQNYPLIAPYADWGGLNVECEKLLKDVGVDYSLPGRPDFPAGNMFWGRTAALKPLFDRKWSYDDFEPEEAQVGKTMAHVIERVWKYVATGKNFSTTEFLAVQPTLAVPSRKKRLSLFVHHEASGQISGADMYYLTQLKAISADVVFISNSDLSAAQLKRVEPLTSKIVSRKNVGFDFGAWRDALNAVGWDRMGTYDEIVFANNSCFGPVFPMEKMFSTMQKSEANFWAVTDFPDSPQSPRAEAAALKDQHIPAHLQSYFMVFDRKVVASSEFRDFWSSVIDVTDILDVIALYETQLTGILLRGGFKCGSYINEAGIIQGRNTHIPEFNTAYSDPISMIALGSPFIKKKISIYSAPSISEVKKLVEGFGHYPSELLIFPDQKKMGV
jgi:lipopolysaccharide biosynthesis protein